MWEETGWGWVQGPDPGSTLSIVTWRGLFTKAAPYLPNHNENATIKDMALRVAKSGRLTIAECGRPSLIPAERSSGEGMDISLIVFSARRSWWRRRLGRLQSMMPQRVARLRLNDWARRISTKWIKKWRLKVKFAFNRYLFWNVNMGTGDTGELEEGHLDSLRNPEWLWAAPGGWI